MVARLSLGAVGIAVAVALLASPGPAEQLSSRTAVTPAIAPEDREHASFVFDHGRHGRRIGPYWSFRVSDGVPRVRFKACPADEPMFSGPGTVGPWTGFPGAMIVAGARCLTLELRERGRPTLRYYLGFGRDDCRAAPPASSPS